MMDQYIFPRRLDKKKKFNETYLMKNKSYEALTCRHNSYYYTPKTRISRIFSSFTVTVEDLQEHASDVSQRPTPLTIPSSNNGN